MSSTRLLLRGVELDDVERASVADRDAALARVVGLAVDRVEAVDRLGDDPRGARLARAARPDEEQSVAEPVESDGVAQRLDDRVLGDDLAERLRSEAAIDRLVRRGWWFGDGLGHYRQFRAGRRRTSRHLALALELDLAARFELEAPSNASATGCETWMRSGSDVDLETARHVDRVAPHVVGELPTCRSLRRRQVRRGCRCDLPAWAGVVQGARTCRARGSPPRPPTRGPCAAHRRARQRPCTRRRSS